MRNVKPVAFRIVRLKGLRPARLRAFLESGPMHRPAHLRRPQRLAALAALVLALLMQALWMPRMATAMAAGVDVCSAQGHRRIPLPTDDGAPQSHQHDCGCPGAMAAAPPPAVAALLIAPSREAPQAAPQGASPSLEWHGALSRGPPAFLL